MKNNLFSCRKFQETIIKLLLFAIVFIVSGGFNTRAFSQVTITAPSLTITGCSPFPTNPDTLGDIVITEGAAANFSVVAGGTLILTAPANFEFTAAGTASATGLELSSVSIALTNASTLTLTFTVTGTSVINSITISGIQVRGITGASGPVTVTRTGGTSLIAGDTNGTVHATLTSVINSVTGGTVSASQTICSGGDPAAFTESAASTGSGTLTYQWKQSTDGYSATLATTSTYDVPSGLTASTTYRRITTSTLGGVSCTANSNDITVTVSSVTGGTIAGAQTICSGGDPAAFTESVSSTGSGTLTYQWKQSTDGYSATLATTSTYDVSSGLTASTTYRRITTSTLGGVSCTASSNDITVTVNSVTAGTIAGAQTICSGGDPAAFTESAASTGSGTLTYQWKQSTDGYSATLATTSTYDVPSGLAASTTYRRITTSTLGGVACTANSNDITVTVNSVTGGTIAGAQTICSGGDPAAFTESVASTGSGTLTYQWKQSTDGYSATLATTSTHDVPSGLTATTTYRRITTSTLGGIACTASSNDITVTVNDVTGGVISSSETICSGGDPAAFTESTASTGSGTLTYQWKQSTDGYSATLATTSTYDVPSGLTASTTYRRITTSTLGGIACTASSNDITVTVNDIIANNTVSTIQTICSGDTPATLTGSTPTGGSGSYTYLWESSTTSGNTGFSSASGTNNTVGYIPGALTVTTWYRRTVVSGPCSPDVSAVIEITVNPVITGNTISANQTICSGAIPAALTGSSPTGGNGSYTYLWESSTSSGTIGFAAATGVNNTSSYSPVSLTATTWYRRVVTSGTCLNTSTAIQVTVTPGISNNDATSAQTICSGASPSVLTGSTPSGGTSSYSYLWEQSTISSSTGFTSASGTNTGISYTPGTLTTTTWYRRTVTSGVCSNVSTAIQITVNPIPVATATTNSQTICSGTAFSTIVLGTSNSVANTTFAWVRNNGSLSAGSVTGLSSSGTGNIVSAALTNTTANPVTVTFTITPTGPGTTFCQGNPITATITVNPLPALSSGTASQSICSGTTFSYTPTSATTGTSFMWTRAAVTGISNSAGNGAGIISEILTNTTSDTVNVTYVYNLSANSCTNSNTYSIIVTVNPTPVLSSTLTPPAVCSGTAFSYIPLSTTSGASFTWTRPVVAGISNSSGSGTGDINETLVNTTSNPVNVIYIYSVTANACSGTVTYSVSATINPLPAQPVFTPYSATVCSGTQNMAFSVDSIQSGVSFLWSATNASLSTTWGGTPNAEFNFETSGIAVITLQVVFISTGCSNTHSENITVSSTTAPSPVSISIIADNWFVCQLSGAGISYQWGYDSIPTLASTLINGAVFQQYHAADYPNSDREYWVIVRDGDCFTKSYVSPQFLGIGQQPADKFAIIFPNPASEKLSVSSNESIDSFRIYEVSGRLIKEKQVMNPQHALSIDIKELMDGMYIIELETAAHNKFLKKLIIKN